MAPLPSGIRGHFGPELRRFVLMQYHQGQVTVERLVDAAAGGWRQHLQAAGDAPADRPAGRVSDRDPRGAARRTWQTAAWVTVDDTGARHRGANGFCTQIGNDDFAWFGTTGSKSRLNFLDLLRAGHTDYVINDAALDYMREHAPGRTGDPANWPRIRRRQFADQAAWQAHLEQLGIAGLQVTPDPVRIATEGALWGAVAGAWVPARSGRGQ